MECLGSHIWNSCTKETLTQLSVDRIDKKIYKRVLKNWDMVAKPLGGMGKFETLTAQIGGILGTDEMDISKKAVIIMCSDNGIVEEGISQTGQEVTRAVAVQMAKGASPVGKMAKVIKADTIPIDIGINCKEKIQGVMDKKIRCGTRNFKKEPAMTKEEAVRAIFTGIEVAAQCKEKGYHILATGEMGIGNTTTSSAVIAALLQCDVKEVTGRGAGLRDEKVAHKQQVIKEAIEKYGLKGGDPFRVLETVGGFDIGGLAGVCIGGGIFHIPIVLDGVISMAAALLAQKIVQGVTQYLIPSHRGKEPAVERIMKELNLEPVINGEMAVGEGTGAVMMLSLLDMALQVYNKRTTFSDIHVKQYERYT